MPRHRGRRGEAPLPQGLRRAVRATRRARPRLVPPAVGVVAGGPGRGGASWGVARMMRMHHCPAFVFVTIRRRFGTALVPLREHLGTRRSDMTRQAERYAGTAQSTTAAPSSTATSPSRRSTVASPPFSKQCAGVPIVLRLMAAIAVHMVLLRLASCSCRGMAGSVNVWPAACAHSADFPDSPSGQSGQWLLCSLLGSS